jgi:nucleoside-diphosphate-sugar epimerase
MVSINELASLIMRISGKTLSLKHVPGPLGVRGRTSDNALIRQKLGWAPNESLQGGLERTYPWIETQVKSVATPAPAVAGIEEPGLVHGHVGGSITGS